jgi:hypothetical protein
MLKALRKLRAWILLRVLKLCGYKYRKLGYDAAQSIAVHQELLSDYFGNVEVNASVLKAIVGNNGYCICRFKVVCPCTHAFVELKKYRRCKCGLFFRR